MAKINYAIKKSIVYLIKFYSFCISPFLGCNCRFYPNCSLYAQEALERYGLIKGLILISKRLLKCHPWYVGSWYDPIN